MNGFSMVLQKFNGSDPGYARDATFIVRKGLIESNNHYSFELLSQPNHFILQLNDQVTAQIRQNTY